MIIVKYFDFFPLLKEKQADTCIKSWWWDKLFLVRVHAREKSCLVHNVKAGVHLSNKQGHEIKDS